MSRHKLNLYLKLIQIIQSYKANLAIRVIINNLGLVISDMDYKINIIDTETKYQLRSIESIPRSVY
jgi:hypothetical protein